MMIPVGEDQTIQLDNRGLQDFKLMSTSGTSGSADSAAGTTYNQQDDVALFRSRVVDEDPLDSDPSTGNCNVEANLSSVRLQSRLSRRLKEDMVR